MITLLSNKKNHLLNEGYTLIELLVVTTIVLLLAGGGIAAFTSFNKRQRVLTAAKELQSYLRTAQTLSRVGERPDGCDELRGYSVITTDVAESIKEVQLWANCPSGNVNNRSYYLPAGTTLDDDLNMTFLNLHGGVTNAEVIQVMDDNGDLRYQFEVTQGGEITGGDFL